MIELKDLKAGMRVKLTDKSWDLEPMDKFSGEVVTIKNIVPTGFHIVENPIWYFHASDVVEIVDDYNVGDIIEVTYSGNMLNEFSFIGQITYIDSYRVATVKIIKSRNLGNQDIFGLDLYHTKPPYSVYGITYTSRIIKKLFRCNYKLFDPLVPEMEYGKICSECEKLNRNLGENKMNKLKDIVERYEINKVDGKQKVTVYFNGPSGKRQESVICMKGDTFDLNIGIEKCVLKYLYGEDAKAQVNEIIRNQENQKRLNEIEIQNQKNLEEIRKRRYEKKRAKRLEKKAEKEAQYQALVLKKTLDLLHTQEIKVPELTDEDLKNLKKRFETKVPVKKSGAKRQK